MKRKATAADFIRINDRLREVITKTEDGCYYAAGHSDASIAEELNIGPTSVATVRKQMFGFIKGAAAAPSVTSKRYNTLVLRLEQAFPQYQWTDLLIHNGDSNEQSN